MTDNYLEHYGVLGMKWGHRKSKTSKKKPKSTREIAKSMSDEELRTKIRRMELEDRYVKLTDKSIRESSGNYAQKGKSVVKQYMNNTANSFIAGVAAATSALVLKGVVYPAIKKRTGIDVTPKKK